MSSSKQLSSSLIEYSAEKRRQPSLASFSRLKLLNHQNTPKTVDITLNCSLGNVSWTCPANYYPSKIFVEDQNLLSAPPPSCPDYFRWIYDDLWPWRETGITKEMVMSTSRTANFRLVILDGKGIGGVKVARANKRVEDEDGEEERNLRRSRQRPPNHLHAGKRVSDSSLFLDG
ncbi:hypothetical protein Salat_0404000 [Sesamum alatum]|uniref:Glycosyl transferase CAP10 domain-containing protein n=1 Tax=Sesamum alatum TaxID=300844 RepID=A0AAE2CZV9_9LAMI|nr:hypothetical protein Salat_0404000 [Sesamum alatum]